MAYDIDNFLEADGKVSAAGISLQKQANMIHERFIVVLKKSFFILT